MRRRSLCVIWMAALLLSLAACAPGQVPVSGDVSTLVEEAKTALDNSLPDVAIARCQQALKQDDRYVQTHFVLGNAYAEKAQFRQAEEQYLAAIALDQDYADAHCNLGVVYYRQGKLSEAEAALRRALSLKRGDAEIRYNLGGVLAALGRLAEAEAEFLEAKRLDPSLPEAYLGLGSVYKLQGKRDEAIAVLKEYVKRSKNAAWRRQAEQMMHELEGTQ